MSLRVRPPLGLHAELEDVSGKTWRWDANARDPQDRPENVSFRTQRGDGFAEGSVTLRRQIDRDYPDLALLTKLRFVGQDGFIAYEGRISEFPRELGSDGHSIQVTAAGYMASARDRKFSEVYVHRNLSDWQGMSGQRKQNLYTAGSDTLVDGTVEPDLSTGLPALSLQLNGDYTDPSVGSWFDAGPGNEVARILASHSYAVLDATFTGRFGVADDDVNTNAVNNTDLVTAASGSGTVDFIPSTARRWAKAELFRTASDTTTVDRYLRFTNLRLLGNHGLDLQGTAPDEGLYVSDMIRDVCARFCPQLDPSGVDDTSYAVKHCVFTASEPYEAFQELNRYHLYELNVWEDGILHFHPPSDLDDWDWEVRTDDPGVEVRLQGDSIEDLANGVVVIYDDFTGREQQITPDDESELLDTSDDNPANIWGIDRWTEPPGGKIAFPTTEDDAIQIGRAALGEFSSPKSPGEITVRGYIRDRRGNWQPTHRVRCGERIRISNHPNDRPRRIVDTDFSDDEQKTLRVSTDNATKRVEGLFDRIETARKAANLA